FRRALGLQRRRQGRRERDPVAALDPHAARAAVTTGSPGLSKSPNGNVPCSPDAGPADRSKCECSLVRLREFPRPRWSRPASAIVLRRPFVGGPAVTPAATAWFHPAARGSSPSADA